jgi:hypothetical protein
MASPFRRATAAAHKASQQLRDCRGDAAKQWKHREEHQAGFQRAFHDIVGLNADIVGVVALLLSNNREELEAA